MCFGSVHAEFRALIARPLTQVEPFVLDLMNLPAWDPGVKSVVEKDGGFLVTDETFNVQVFHTVEPLAHARGGGTILRMHGKGPGFTTEEALVVGRVLDTTVVDYSVDVFPSYVFPWYVFPWLGRA